MPVTKHRCISKTIFACRHWLDVQICRLIHICILLEQYRDMGLRRVAWYVAVWPQQTLTNLYISNTNLCLSTSYMCVASTPRLGTSTGIDRAIAALNGAHKICVAQITEMHIHVASHTTHFVDVIAGVEHTHITQTHKRTQQTLSFLNDIDFGDCDLTILLFSGVWLLVECTVFRFNYICTDFGTRFLDTGANWW